MKVYTDKVLLGARKVDGKLTFLKLPRLVTEQDGGTISNKWEFGMLFNEHTSYSLRDYKEKFHLLTLIDGECLPIHEIRRGYTMKECLLADYAINPLLLPSLQKFCEVVTSIFQVIDIAELYGQIGGVIEDDDESDRLHSELLPKLFDDLTGLFFN